MRIPASPNFIKFFQVLSQEEKSLFLDRIHTFFKTKVSGYSNITKFRGERIHPSLKSIKSHLFLIEGIDYSESWEISFFNTAIPHARVEMSSCHPFLKKDCSLEMEYTQLLLKQSLVDIAEGFDDAPKPLLQKLLKFHPENCFATAGETVWVYLMLKIRALPELYDQFLIDIEPKLPFFEFGNYLIKEVGNDYREIIQISMNQKHYKSFLQQNDTLILNALGQDKMAHWLSSLNIELDTWLSAISYSQKL
ncbi:hypothetical protein [Microcoleus sp. PH2017_28_MFU_U_A]|uniref:hypothetical protein n=1 Tax=Microcoleus sp. PH2017_28_MFU_U_A TaxID=2798838 RepID=UPI001D5D4811|nr:hypothetical protein [Microcoleus sp. PH2017_28_MFU_U_A]MCC3595197.1 hypothetical protein [Microcoleus sp. PH2017_28_MFU_U_A]